MCLRLVIFAYIYNVEVDMEAVSLNKFIEILKNGSFSDNSKYDISLGSYYYLGPDYNQVLISRGKRIGEVSIRWRHRAYPPKPEFYLSWIVKRYEEKHDDKYLDLLASLIYKNTGWRRIANVKKD